MSEHWLGVVGGRDFDDYSLLVNILDPIMGGGDFIGIVSGGARGADKLAERFADAAEVEKRVFLPNWDRDGRVAGFLRNQKIVDRCTMLVAFWDGKSTGTKDSIDRAIAAGKIVVIVPYRAAGQKQMTFKGL